MWRRLFLRSPGRSGGLPVAAEQVQSVGVDDVRQLGVGNSLRAPPRTSSRLGHGGLLCNGDAEKRCQHVAAVQIAADGGGEQAGGRGPGVHGYFLFSMVMLSSMWVSSELCARAHQRSWCQRRPLPVWRHDHMLFSVLLILHTQTHSSYTQWMSYWLSLILWSLTLTLNLTTLTRWALTYNLHWRTSP